MILFGDLQEGGRVEVDVKDNDLELVYKKREEVTDQVIHTSDEKKSQ